VQDLLNTTVTDGQWSKFLNEIQPLSDKEGQPKTGKSLTIAKNKRTAIQNLYENDNRVAPWSGTAWGVVQCRNTYEQQTLNATLNGAERNQRNQLKTIKGDFSKLDRETLDILTGVLAPV
jgi:hypothetical protein